MNPSQLHVIAVISNPIRYRSRYELYKKFEKHMQDSGVTLWTVETAYGDRPFAVTDPGGCNSRHLQLRTFHELWHKENMINLAINRLPASAEYIAWIDADVQFARQDWAEETLHALQHYMIVQPWSEAHDLSPTHEIMAKHKGFAFAYVNESISGNNYGKFWHTGYAWAARREALDALGGLMDFPVLGSADHNMAKALINRVEESIDGRMHPSFFRMARDWQKRAERYVRRDLGYVPGVILHSWHGKKSNRKYVDRWKILVDEQYNPDSDIVRDCQGLWQLYDHGDERSIRLRDKIRAYFRQRNEDSIDL